MVKAPAARNGVGKGKGKAAAVAAAPSNASPKTPGSANPKRFKKRAKAKADREKTMAAAAAAANEAAATATALVQSPKPVQTPKPADVVDAGNTQGTAEKNGKNGDGGKRKNRRERERVRVPENGVREKKREEEDGEERISGFIFMCSGKTKPECYQNRVFGLPKGKMEVVEKIKPGTRLFLYDFDLKLLYGVYKASTKGGADLVRNAFGGRFPAQVKFRIDKDCLPLPESSFKHAIKENYNSKGKFTPELNSRQVRKLLAEFKPVSSPQRAPRQYAEDGRRSHHVEDRRRPQYVEDRRRPQYVEDRHAPQYVEDRRAPQYVEDRRAPFVVHVPPPEDSYRSGHLIRAPPPIESQYSHSLASMQDDRHGYYEHMPLAPESQHVAPVPEPRHVPPVYYQHLAPASNDPYYRPQVDPIHERVAHRIASDITTRDPPLARDYRALPGELGVRADRVEELYRSDQLASHPVDLARHPAYLRASYENPNPAYDESFQRPVSTRANITGVPVSSLYSFAGAPAYR